MGIAGFANIYCPWRFAHENLPSCTAVVLSENHRFITGSEGGQSAHHVCICSQMSIITLCHSPTLSLWPLDIVSLLTSSNEHASVLLEQRKWLLNNENIRYETKQTVTSTPDTCAERVPAAGALHTECCISIDWGVLLYHRVQWHETGPHSQSGSVAIRKMKVFP